VWSRLLPVLWHSCPGPTDVRSNFPATYPLLSNFVSVANWFSLFPCTQSISLIIIHHLHLYGIFNMVILGYKEKEGRQEPYLVCRRHHHQICHTYDKYLSRGPRTCRETLFPVSTTKNRSLPTPRPCSSCREGQASPFPSSSASARTPTARPGLRLSERTVASGWILGRRMPHATRQEARLYLRDEILPQLHSLRSDTAGLEGSIIPPLWIMDYDPKTSWPPNKAASG